MTAQSLRTDKTPTELARDVTVFNARLTPGSPVAVCVLRSGPWYFTKTRSAAWVAPEGALVQIAGRVGGWACDCVRAIEPGEDLPPLPPWPPRETEADAP